MQLVSTFIECPNCKKWYSYTPFSLYPNISDKRENAFPFSEYIRCSSCEKPSLINHCRYLIDTAEIQNNALYKEFLDANPKDKNKPLPLLDSSNFMEITYSIHPDYKIEIEGFVTDYLTLLDKKSKNTLVDELLLRADLWKIFNYLGQETNSFSLLWKTNRFPQNIKLLMNAETYKKTSNKSKLKQSIHQKYNKLHSENKSRLLRLLEHKDILNNRDIEHILEVINKEILL